MHEHGGILVTFIMNTAQDFVNEVLKDKKRSWNILELCEYFGENGYETRKKIRQVKIELGKLGIAFYSVPKQGYKIITTMKDKEKVHRRMQKMVAGIAQNILIPMATTPLLEQKGQLILQNTYE
jgi:hypothetical protein